MELDLTITTHSFRIKPEIDVKVPHMQRAGFLGGKRGKGKGVNLFGAKRK